MRPIFLIGYMCSGKTTLGRALARALDMRFIDLDEHIERMEGATVSQIFAQRGEGEFRRIESAALDSLCASADVVIACGGGTPCQSGAMDKMNACGITVHLAASLDRLVERLLDGKDRRPLLKSIQDAGQMRDFASAMLAERLPYYQRARLEFDSSRLETPQEISQSADALAQIIRNQ